MEPDVSQRRHEVVITGVGLVTPLGREEDAVWERLTEGPPAVEPLDGCLPGSRGAVVRDFDAAREIRPRRILRMVNRVTCLGLAAADAAWRDAGLEPDVIEPERFGIYTGTGESELQPDDFLPGVAESLDDHGRLDLDRWATHGIEQLDPYLALTSLANNALCYASIAHRLMGPNNNYVKSATASSQALGEAMRAIRHGRADAVMVIGLDSLTNPMAVAAYNQAGLLCPPGSAMAPFDAARRGFLPGEGAAALVLERAGVAQARGARMRGRLEGYAQGMAGGWPDGEADAGPRIAGLVERCLADAGRSAGDVDFVVAHGDATTAGDLAEARAIALVCGGRLAGAPVTATKPRTGYLGAASGTVEVALGLAMAARGVVPPVANLERTDPRIELDLVRGRPRAARLQAGLHLSRSVAGQFAALLFTGPGSRPA